MDAEKQIVRMAHVLGGIVVNILEAPEGFKLPSGETVPLVSIEEEPQIGWRYADGAFVDVPSDVDDLPRPAMKARYLAQIRYEKETGGINIVTPLSEEIDEWWQPTDRTAQAMLAMLWQAKPNDDISFKTSKGFAIVKARDLTPVIDAVRKHVQECFRAEHIVLEKINSGDLINSKQIREAFEEAYNNSDS